MRNQRAATRGRGMGGRRPDLVRERAVISRRALMVSVTAALTADCAGLPLIRPSDAQAGDLGASQCTRSGAPLTEAEFELLRASVDTPALAAASHLATGEGRQLATGVRQRGLPGAVTASDRWHMGSITKSMTATLVARCVEAGVLGWDDTIGVRLGARFPDMRAEYRDATLRHLLSHRAGLQTEVVDLATMRLPLQEADPRESRLTVARQALRQPPAGPRERTFLYSNSGYVIAGVLLEEALGAPWETLIRSLLFRPLGMRATGFGAPGAIGGGDQPVGHASWLTESVTPHPPGSPLSDIPAAWGPAGRVHASLGDMMKYLDAHRRRSGLLRRETWNTLHTPPFGGDYALGWHVRSEGLWHNGTNSLWYAEALVDPAGGRASIAACNDGRLAAVRPIVHAALMGVLT
ncbi:MAG: beta-lactamase family protein [Hyphomonadaceae bacterium]|nr:beta-lactamase family protein [Hyphomonadaceae bacterium]